MLYENYWKLLPICSTNSTNRIYFWGANRFIFALSRMDPPIQCFHLKCGVHAEWEIPLARLRSLCTKVKHQWIFILLPRPLCCSAVVLIINTTFALFCCYDGHHVRYCCYWMAAFVEIAGCNVTWNSTLIFRDDAHVRCHTISVHQCIVSVLI